MSSSVCSPWASSLSSGPAFRLREHGTLDAHSLKPLHVTGWLKGKGGSDTTEYNAITAVHRALHYAVKQGLLTKNPLAAMEKPAPEHRERIIEDNEWQTILDSVRPRAHKFIQEIMGMSEEEAPHRPVHEEPVHAADRAAPEVSRPV